MSEPSMRG